MTKLTKTQIKQQKEQAELEKKSTPYDKEIKNLSKRVSYFQYATVEQERYLQTIKQFLFEDQVKLNILEEKANNYQQRKK